MILLNPKWVAAELHVKKRMISIDDRDSRLTDSLDVLEVRLDATPSG
jgi:hypothetical protein